MEISMMGYDKTYGFSGVPQIEIDGHNILGTTSSNSNTWSYILTPVVLWKNSGIASRVANDSIG